MTYADIVKRVNAVANWFADTVDVNYVEGLSASEVRSMDADYKEDVWLFPEMKRMGY